MIEIKAILIVLSCTAIVSAIPQSQSIRNPTKPPTSVGTTAKFAKLPVPVGPVPTQPDPTEPDHPSTSQPSTTVATTTSAEMSSAVTTLRTMTVSFLSDQVQVKVPNTPIPSETELVTEAFQPHEIDKEVYYTANFPAGSATNDPQNERGNDNNHGCKGQDCAVNRLWEYAATSAIIVGIIFAVSIFITIACITCRKLGNLP